MWVEITPSSRTGGDLMNYKMMQMWAQAISVHINVAGEDIDDKYLRDLVMHLKDIVNGEDE
jgi:hypothetical protein